MDDFNKRLDRRLERLERELVRRPAPVSPKERAQRDARRLKIAGAALEGRKPEDLDEGERRLFEKALFYAPIFKELVNEGVLDAYGNPAGEDASDGFGHEP